MIEAAENAGSEPGRSSVTSGNTGCARREAQGYSLTCVIPENATESGGGCACTA